MSLYSDTLLFENFDNIQNNMDQLKIGVSNTDSLILNALTDINSNLVKINTTLATPIEYTLWGVSWDILLPALISIVIFILGYLINFGYSLYKKRQERSLIKTTIVTWAESNLKYLNNYVKSIKDLAEKIKNSNEIPPQGFNVYHITIDVIAKFSIEQLTDALFIGLPIKKEKVNKKAEMLNIFMSSVSYISETQKIIMKHYDEYTLTCNELLDAWNMQWTKYLKNIEQNNMRFAQSAETPEKKYFLKLNSLIQQHVGNDYTFEDCIKMIISTRTYMDEFYIPNDKILDTIYIFGDLYLIYKKIDELKKYHDIFMSYHNYLKLSVSQFENVILFYSNYK